jgi:UDP-perosamine 4-acetyltransferase
VIETLIAAGHEIAGLLDDAPGGPVLGWPRLGPLAMLETLRDEGLAVVVALGENTLRARLGERCAALGYEAPPLIHPTTLISPSARISPGVQVMARAVVGPEATLGSFVLVNTAAVIEHECTVGRAAHLGPGAVICGGVQVGERTLIGAGAVVRPGLRIGEDTVIGAGAAVTADVPANGRWGGVPAHPL